MTSRPSQAERLESITFKPGQRWLKKFCRLAMTLRPCHWTTLNTTYVSRRHRSARDRMLTYSSLR